MKGLGNQTAKTYIDTLAGESIGIIDEDEYQSPAMINGSAYELAAMQLYLTDHAEGEVLYGSKIFIPLGENAGVSPDAVELLEGERIYLEVKCPSAPNKYVSLVKCTDGESLKETRPDVYWQCVMNMLVLNCSFSKVIVFHPAKGLKIIVVERVEADIDSCSVSVTNAVEAKLQLTQLLSV
jgi:hypothetical protein